MKLLSYTLAPRHTLAGCRKQTFLVFLVIFVEPAKLDRHTLSSTFNLRLKMCRQANPLPSFLGMSRLVRARKRLRTTNPDWAMGLCMFAPYLTFTPAPPSHTHTHAAGETRAASNSPHPPSCPGSETNERSAYFCVAAIKIFIYFFLPRAICSLFFFFSSFLLSASVSMATDC